MITTTAPTSAVALPYAEIALDPATMDLVVPKTVIRGAPAIIQRLRVRLGFWLGEWFLDTTQGVPYRERVFVKSPKIPTINALFRKVIGTTPGIMAVPSCALGPINTRSRSATLSFVGQLSDGSQIVATNEPFRILSL